MSKLYRGVSLQLDQEFGGRLTPRGDQKAAPVKYGDGGRYGQVDYGKTENNAVRGHQLESGRYDGCYISSTLSYERAVEFTTHDDSDGYVYILDRDLFEAYGVVEKEFRDPEYPDEAEVTIRAADGKDIPEGVIIEKIFHSCV